MLGVLLATATVLSVLQQLNRNFESLGRPALERYLRDRLPAAPVWWAGGRPGSGVQLAFWRWLAEDAAGLRVLALPAHEPREVRALADMQELLEGDYQLAPLSEDAPVPGLVLSAPRQPPTVGRDDGAAATARTSSWVLRTLSPSGLRFCPYTASAATSGSGLEAYGVEPAPIAYAHCAGASLPSLLTSFWSAADAMLASGESGTSSVVLSAPRWDDRWEAWCRTVFPLLEASVLSADLGRQLGIVCFHPEYVTPDEQWLARHRFGHMHSVARLRSYVEQHDQALSERTSDAELLWAGSYQRRSPHAMINVRRPSWARVGGRPRRGGCKCAADALPVLRPWMCRCCGRGSSSRPSRSASRACSTRAICASLWRTATRSRGRAVTSGGDTPVFVVPRGPGRSLFLLFSAGALSRRRGVSLSVFQAFLSPRDAPHTPRSASTGHSEPVPRCALSAQERARERDNNRRGQHSVTPSTPSRCPRRPWP